MIMQNINASEIDLTDAVSDAVWNRIRSLTLSTARYENFVRLGSEPAPNSGELKKIIWDGCNPDDDSKAIAMEFLLMSLNCALEPLNTKILLNIGESISPKDIARKLDKGELIIRERVNDLSQSGFLGKNYESGTVFLTDAGQSLMIMLNKIADQLTNTIIEKLPELINTGESKT